MSTTTTGLTNTEQALLYFVGFLLLALGGVSIPSGLPTAVSAVFFIIGAVAITVKELLGSISPPTITNSQQATLMAIAAILVSAGTAVSNFYPSDIWVGLVVGVLGAVVAAVKELAGTAVVTPAPTPTTTTPTPPAA